MTEIQKRLYALQDKGYQEGSIKLNPSVDADTIIGVRIPQLRTYAKELIKNGEADAFLSSLPHEYFEENMLHALLLCEEKEFSRAVEMTEAFLPYANSWALTDSLSPKSFSKTPERLLPYIEKWLSSELLYTVRFGILCLMRIFLDERFDEKYLLAVGKVQSEEYYVNMMRAWYFATALAKQYDTTVRLLEKSCLDRWTHNKTIQKAVESYRIPDDTKAYLRTLRRKS